MEKVLFHSSVSVVSSVPRSETVAEIELLPAPPPTAAADMTRTLDGAAAACAAAAAAAAVSYWFIRNWKMIHQVQGHIFQIVDSRCWWRQWAGAGLNNICSALKPNT